MAADGDNVTPGGENASDQDATDQIPSQTITLAVLQIIHEAHQQHGLRHEDYQRYRRYCSRRLKRIRKSLHFPQGEKRRVTPKKITPDNVSKDARYLHLLLFSSERAWAYAMQLKGEANSELRKTFHMRSRLKKAQIHSEELEKLSDSPHCDARTKMECKAYNLWMKGTSYFELQDWKLSLEMFNGAQAIYETLSKAFTEDLAELYQQRVNDISPNIRFCLYNTTGNQKDLEALQAMRVKGGDNPLTAKLDELLAQTREKQSATLSEITWLGRTVPVKVEAVRLFLLHHQESSKELEAAEKRENKLSIYESLVKQCIDALQAQRDILQDDPVFKATIRGQPMEGKVSQQHHLHSYLVYLRLMCSVERNMLLIEQLKPYLPGAARAEEGRRVTKPQDLVRLYDVIIQSLSEIPNLPGTESDPRLIEVINTRVAGYKAFRSYYIAQGFASLKKWTESVALFKKSMDLLKKAISSYKALKSPAPDQKKELGELEELLRQVSSTLYICHASAILNTNESVDKLATLSTEDKRPLVDRLEEYVDDPSLVGKRPNLVPFPPDFQGVPCRPLFFDLAQNHVAYPALDDKEQKKAGGGITGLVKGWLWGGGKK